MSAASIGLKPAPGAVELAQIPALDEVHHDVVRRAVRVHLLDFDDVRVLECGADFAFAAEQVDDRAVAAAALWRRLAVGLLYRLRSTLTACMLPVLAMDGAKHAGERAGAHAIQHLVVAVEEAGPRVAPHQPLELILRQQATPQERLLERRERDGRRAQLAPDGLWSCSIVDDIDVQRSLGQLFRSFNAGHDGEERGAGSLERRVFDVTPCSVLRCS